MAAFVVDGVFFDSKGDANMLYGFLMALHRTGRTFSMRAASPEEIMAHSDMAEAAPGSCEVLTQRGRVCGRARTTPTMCALHATRTEKARLVDALRDAGAPPDVARATRSRADLIADLAVWQK